MERLVWSGLHVTVTHTGLEAPGAVSADRKGRDAVITLGMVRAVMVILSGNDSATTAAAQDHFGWSAWNAPAFPERDSSWKAVFSMRDRTFEGFYDESSPHPEPIRVPVPQQLTDPMWQMIEASKSTVLSVGLTGNPTLQEITHAAQQRQFRAALIEAVLY